MKLFNWFPWVKKDKVSHPKPCEIYTPKNNNHLQTTALGYLLVKYFEGYYAKAYKDIGGVLTIGYGHTNHHKENFFIKPNSRITRTYAERLLVRDLKIFEKRVKDLVKVPLNQQQFDALVSFDFNTGGLRYWRDGKLKTSTLLKSLNDGDIKDTIYQFSRWNKDDGKTVNGLTKRRRMEAELFKSGTYPKEIL